MTPSDGKGGSEEERSVSGRGDEASCCLGLKSPSIILRNMIMPRDMWEEFPRGAIFIKLYIKFIVVCGRIDAVHLRLLSLSAMLPVEM
jgi:hypothetical protein